MISVPGLVLILMVVWIAMSVGKGNLIWYSTFLVSSYQSLVLHIHLPALPSDALTKGTLPSDFGLRYEGLKQWNL